MTEEAPRYSPIEVYLTVNGGLRAIEFYKAAFGAALPTKTEGRFS